MKSFKIIACSAIIAVSSAAFAKNVEYIEDPYAAQAPQELVEQAEQAAQLFEFDKPYELVVPKKAGIQINPWNKYIAFGINPQTKNSFILINPSWFKTLPADEQLFLLGTNFLNLKYGSMPLSVKVAPYISLVFTILLITLFFFFLGKTRLAAYRKWVRVLAALAIMIVLNLLILNRLFLAISNRLIFNHSAYLNEMAVQKTGNRQAGINAFEKFEQAVKQEIADGQTFLKPYEDRFAKYAQELKK